MTRKILLTGLILTALFSCSDELVINTDKDIFYDDLADITALNGYFYSTNHDRSGHAGSQIDLMKYEKEGDHVFLSDRYELELNCQ